MIEADFQREYRIDAGQLWDMSSRRFTVLLGALSAEALFRRAYQRTPRQVTDRAEIAALMGLPASS